MPVLQLKIIHGGTSSFSHILYPQFVLPRHKHVEYEIMIVTAGCGKQFVGDNVMDYTTGTLSLIGSNIPHFHLCNTTLTGQTQNRSKGEVLQFPPALFPVAMSTLPDYAGISQLLQKSQYGIRFQDAALSEEIYGMMQEVDRLVGTSRLIQLFWMLEKLSRCDCYTLFSQTAYNAENSFTSPHEPVNKVYTYLFNHFREKVKLQDIAAYVRQNPAALCRYFKQRTDKTIFECLAEIRIEHACKLLSHSQLPVSQIAYASGFNNLSHFNRQFQEITTYSPSSYREQINR